MGSNSCFSSVFLLPPFFLRMWIAFFISPSVLFWIIALLLLGKFIMFDCTTVYQSLYTMFSWFCSSHSVSVPGGRSSSHGIPPVHYSFEHNSIPSPRDTTFSLFFLKFEFWRHLGSSMDRELGLETEGSGFKFGPRHFLAM